MLFVSLLPHTISVVCDDGTVRVIAPSGAVARCSVTDEIVDTIDSMYITRQTFGEVVGLPEPEEGVAFIVSRMVAAAVPERHDLYIPGPLIRDAEGVVVGCSGLSIL